MIGTSWESARSWMRRIFSTVFGPQEPALTAGSLAISAIGRPPTVPIPVTTPSAPRPSCSQFASRLSSARESWSRSRATRSRTGSFSCSATFLRCRSGPPSSAASRAALMSLTTAPEPSGPGLLLGLGIDDPGFLRTVLVDDPGFLRRVLVDDFGPLSRGLTGDLRLRARNLSSGLSLCGRNLTSGLSPAGGSLITLGLDLLLVLAGEWIELLRLVERVGTPLRAMLGDGSRQLCGELLGVRKDVVSPPYEVGDHCLDVLAALRSLLDDPARLCLGSLDGIASLRIRLGLGRSQHLLRRRTSLFGVGIGGGPGLPRVGVHLAAGLLGLHVGRVDRAPGLLLGLGANLLRALLGLREDRARPLSHPLQLSLDGVRAGLVTGPGLEPVSKTRQELLDLVLVVTPLR